MLRMRPAAGAGLMRYRDAGVDIERADAVKESIGEAVRSTWGPGVLRLPRGFAGVIEWPSPGGAAGERTLLAATHGRRRHQAPPGARRRAASPTRRPISSITAPTTCSSTAPARSPSSTTSRRASSTRRRCVAVVED